MPYYDNCYQDIDDLEEPSETTCKFCGKGNLAWEQEKDGRWVLYSIKTGEVHKCLKPVKKLTLDTILS